MAFDVSGGGRRQAGILPGALDGEALANRIRSGDAFPLAVARSPHAAQNCVDLVVIALRIGQALEQEDRCAFSHHETIGTLCIRTSAGRGQGADLAELYESGGAHVAVDTAGDRHVIMILYETLGC